MRPVGLLLGVLVVAGGRAAADDKPCLDCHAMIQTNVSKGNSHPAIAAGCTACHSDHTRAASASTAAPSPIKPPYLTAPPSALCSGCHAEVGHKEFIHEPAKMDCTLCHNPHGGLRFGLRAESNALCLECHSTASGSKFDANDPAALFGGQITLPPRYFQNLKLLELNND